MPKEWVKIYDTQIPAHAQRIHVGPIRTIILISYSLDATSILPRYSLEYPTSQINCFILFFQFSFQHKSSGNNFGILVQKPMVCSNEEECYSKNIIQTNRNGGSPVLFIVQGCYNYHSSFTSINLSGKEGKRRKNANANTQTSAATRSQKKGELRIRSCV